MGGGNQNFGSREKDCQAFPDFGDCVNDSGRRTVLQKCLSTSAPTLSQTPWPNFSCAPMSPTRTDSLRDENDKEQERITLRRPIESMPTERLLCGATDATSKIGRNRDR